MPLIATGRDDPGASHMFTTCSDQWRPMAIGGSMSHPGAIENPVSKPETGFNSEGDGARTRNHRIDSPVL
jgi:hypothetical protein